MYYVKSFPDDFKGLERVQEGVRVMHQTTQDILDNFHIDTNTVSFGRGERLCTTFLDKNYTTTYREQGIIFGLPEHVKPDYIFPFDLNCISQQDNPEVEYAKMRESLPQHYGPEMIPGFEEFQSTTYEEMKKKFGDQNGIIYPENVLKKVNEFRISHNRDPLIPEKHLKFFKYNEAIFLRKITIQPIAIYGKTDIAKYWAHTYNLPLYQNAESFYQEKKLGK